VIRRFFEAGTLLALASVLVAAADNKQTAKPVPPPAVERIVPAPPKGPKRINDPGASIAQRLLELTPEQRERALEKFPPGRQAQIRQNLAKLDSRPPKRKQQLIQEYHELVSLPADKQLLVRAQIQAFNRLPDERKQILGPELQRLRLMPEGKREARLASEEFRNRFTPTEQKMMEDVSRYLPLR
jgi:Spy/CpxP family protein refolding chaperone